MSRKRITQLFPWILPIRKKQRLFCFYTGMKLDRNHYARERLEGLLPHQVFETSQSMYNHETGFDMKYQENKVFNLRLAAATIDKIVIKPQETFSFWQLVRYADSTTSYKNGLVVVDGDLTTAPGGGLCQMSNLLFWLFLHTPLSIVERHGHVVKEFPDGAADGPLGVDATISEGWLDLKLRNETEMTFQINITFDEENITGRILADQEAQKAYEIINGTPNYYREDGEVFQEVSICQRVASKQSGEYELLKPLYKNICKIGYELSSEIRIEEKKED